MFFRNKSVFSAVAATGFAVLAGSALAAFDPIDYQTGGTGNPFLFGQNGGGASGGLDWGRTSDPSQSRTWLSANGRTDFRFNTSLGTVFTETSTANNTVANQRSNRSGNGGGNAVQNHAIRFFDDMSTIGATSLYTWALIQIVDDPEVAGEITNYVSDPGNSIALTLQVSNPLPGAGEVASIGVARDSNEWQLYELFAPGSGPGGTKQFLSFGRQVVIGETVLLAMKYDTDADEITGWLDPNFALGEDDPFNVARSQTISKTLNALNVDRVGLFSEFSNFPPNQAGHEILWDNVNVTVDSPFIPEPASLALLAVGSAVLFGRRRQQSL